MAFTVTARHAVAPSTIPRPTAVSNSTTPTADSLLLVGFGSSHNADPSNWEISVSGGGLTWTDIQEVDGALSPPWYDSAVYKLDAGLYRATVGAAPTSFAVTGNSGGYAFSSLVACDITGHDTSAPIAQSKIAYAPASGDGPHNATVTLDSAPTVGNLLLLFATSSDGVTGFTQPYAGSGNGFTASHNQAGGYCQSYIGYRVVQSGDSSTIQIDDVGDSVGNWVLIAVEIAAESGGSTTLTIQGSDHTTASDNVALTQTHYLQIAETAHSHASSDVTLALGAVSLSVASADHTHSAGAAALEHVHVLSVDEAAHTHTSDDVTVTGVGTLSVQGADHSHAADAIGLSQTHSVVVADANHAVHSDEVGQLVEQGSALYPADDLYPSDGLYPSEGAGLGIQSSFHGHTADNAPISQTHILAIAGSSHLHSSQEPVLAEGAILSIASTQHEAFSDDVGLISVTALVAAGADHSVSSDNVAVTYVGDIVIQDASHAHAASSLTLLLGAALDIDDSATLLDSTDVVLWVDEASGITYWAGEGGVVGTRHGVAGEEIEYALVGRG